MAAETGLQIDGKFYETPDPGTFNLDECQVLYDYTGMTLEDFVPLEGETDEEHDERVGKFTRHPGFKKTLLHVAYQRGNPKLPAGRVRDLVGKANWLEPFTVMGDEPAESDDIPPAQTSEPDRSSPRSSLENDDSPKSGSESSGMSSSNGGDEPDGTPVSTGRSRSDTSLISPQETWAA